MEETSVMMVGMNYDRISQGLAILETQNINQSLTAETCADFSIPNVSYKGLRIINCFDYVNRIVWSK